MEQSYDIRGLLPWFTLRPKYTVDHLRTLEFIPIVNAAVQNINRADTIIDSILITTYLVDAVAANLITGQPVNDSPSLEHFYKTSFDRWEYLLRSPINVLKIGAQRILQAYLVQIYTAFETLVADIWETAVNKHPHILAELAGSKTRSADLTDRDRLRDDPKTIRLDLLQRVGYDTNGQMGTILRSKVRLDSLTGMREAYRSAFSVDFNNIIKPLEDQSLDVFAALRQVIVHRSGVADAEYLRKVRNKPHAPQVNLGEEILITADGLSSLLLAVNPLSCALLSGVDNWLAEH